MRTSENARHEETRKRGEKRCATCTSSLAVLASCPAKGGKRVLIPYRLIFLDHRSLDSPPVSLSQHECTDATQSQIDYECLTSGSCVLVGRELCVLQPAPWPVIRCPSTAAKSLLPTPSKISPRDCFTMFPVKNLPVFGDGASSRLRMLGCGNGAGAEAALEI